ncbi:hypothetical protein [Sorlinia euscelidii]|uniref:hypothetical protein n=1 Tax=Sorlinia euscelidii TaxID=3081148 RepID=UPI00374DFFA7
MGSNPTLSAMGPMEMMDLQVAAAARVGNNQVLHYEVSGILRDHTGYGGMKNP